MLVCAILSAAVWYFARKLDLFGGEDNDDVDNELNVELAEVTRRRDSKVSSKQTTPYPHKRTNDEDIGTLVDETDRMTREAAEPELRFNLMDLSDHMEDSMEVSTPVRQDVSIFWTQSGNIQKIPPQFYVTSSQALAYYGWKQSLYFSIPLANQEISAHLWYGMNIYKDKSNINGIFIFFLHWKIKGKYNLFFYIFSCCRYKFFPASRKF